MVCWSTDMVMAQAHYLLFCDTHIARSSLTGSNAPKLGLGRWLFVLEQLDGTERLEIADSEPSVSPDRLALLCVVRGLEALEQPSQVKLVTTSRYVARGLRYGLSTWRDSDYMWERFGTRKPIRNADLWQRIDGAMNFHCVSCRLIRSTLSTREVHIHTGSNRVNDAETAQTAPSRIPHNLDSRAGRQIAATNEKNAQTAIATHSAAPPQTQRPRVEGSFSKWWRGRMQPRPVLYGT